MGVQSAAAPAGLGMVGVGTAANAYGQHQGITAMQHAWGRQDQDQRGYDDQIRAKTAELLAQLTPDSITGTAQRDELAAKTDTATRNAATAIATNGARRGAGGKAGAESRGVAKQSSGGVLARALDRGQVQAAMQALLSGGQKLDLLGRQYRGDTGFIRENSRARAGVAQQEQQAAGFAGAPFREIGTGLNTIGQLGINYGLSQPGKAAPAGDANAWETQAPGGGWAASRTYNLTPDMQGAWS